MDELDPYHPKNRAEDHAKSEALIRDMKALLDRLDEEPELRESFAQAGYGEATLAEGRRMLQRLIDAMKHEKEAWRRVVEADAAAKHQEEELMRVFSLQANIVRHNLKDDPAALRRFGLERPLGEADEDDSF